MAQKRLIMGWAATLERTAHTAEWDSRGRGEIDVLFIGFLRA